MQYPWQCMSNGAGRAYLASQHNQQNNYEASSEAVPGQQGAYWA